MKKKSFWRRTNRGFWVSMVLLLAVVLYITVTQLMLIPQRGEIQKLSDAVNKIWEETTLMTDEQATALNSSKEKQEAVKARIRQGLTPLFVEGSAYLDSACVPSWPKRSRNTAVSSVHTPAYIWTWTRAKQHHRGHRPGCLLLRQSGQREVLRLLCRRGRA